MLNISLYGDSATIVVITGMVGGLKLIFLKCRSSTEVLLAKVNIFVKHKASYALILINVVIIDPQGTGITPNIDADLACMEHLFGLFPVA